MGGIGSGGSNRKSKDTLKRIGAFRPARHEKRIGEVVDLPLPRAPSFPAPPVLGRVGKDLWAHLWTHVVGLSERDKPLVEQCCISADQANMAYQAYMKALKLDDLPIRAMLPKQSPGLARALAGLKKELRQDLALLGLSARDRAAASERPARPRDALLQLRRKGGRSG